jgi:hypothetical protein
MTYKPLRLRCIYGPRAPLPTVTRDLSQLGLSV